MTYRASSLVALTLTLGCSSSTSAGPGPTSDAGIDTAVVVVDDAAADADAKEPADTNKPATCTGHAESGASLAIKSVWTLGVSASRVHVADGAGRFVVGSAYLPSDFGLGKLTPREPNDLAIARFDDKAARWAYLGSGLGNEYVNTTAVTSSGELIVGGEFGMVGAWGGESMTLGDKTVDADEYSDGFVAKIGGDGKPAWLTRLGDAGRHYVRRVSLDARGHVYFGLSSQWSKLVISGSIFSDGNAVAGEIDGSGNVVWLRGTGGDGEPAAALPRGDGSTWFFAAVSGNYTTAGMSKKLVGTVRYTLNATGVETASTTYDGLAFARVVPAGDGHVVIGSVIASTTVAGKAVDPTSSPQFIGRLDAAGAFAWIVPLSKVDLTDVVVSADGVATLLAESGTAPTRAGTLSVDGRGTVVARVDKDGAPLSLQTWGCATPNSITLAKSDGAPVVVVSPPLSKVAFDDTHTIDGTVASEKLAIVTLGAK